MGRRRERRVAVALAVSMVLAVGVAGCSSTSDTAEVDARRTDQGPLPTAGSTPAGSSSRSAATGSGSVDVAELVRRIDAATSENDLCTLLTGRALADVTGADLDLQALLQDPQGFTDLFAALDRLFGHMVTIAPASVQGDLSTMQSVWKGVATLDPRGADAAQRA
ncbi:MAG: hypothetical protein ACOYOP_16335, partial [Microthrixaceae bacterium]